MAGSLLLPLLALACLEAGSASKAAQAGVVARTKAALQQQERLRDDSQAAAANETAVAADMRRLEDVSKSTAAGFRQRREKLDRELHHFADKVAEETARARSAQNISAMEQAVSASDEAVNRMWLVSERLGMLDAEQLRSVRDAVYAEADVVLAPARRMKTLAGEYQRKAHRAMDPLTGMGDDAEDLADGFNDQADEAESSALRALNGLISRIQDRARFIVEDAGDTLADAKLARGSVTRRAQAAADRAAMILALITGQQPPPVELAAAGVRAASPAELATAAANGAALGAALASLAVACAGAWWLSGHRAGRLQPLLA